LAVAAVDGGSVHLLRRDEIESFVARQRVAAGAGLVISCHDYPPDCCPGTNEGRPRKFALAGPRHTRFAPRFASPWRCPPILRTNGKECHSPGREGMRSVAKAGRREAA